jgi:aspartate kinase
MAIVVQKYGGTSVGNVDRIKQVADRIAATRRSGREVVVVVSAMGQTTDNLVELARQVTDNPPPREMDMLLSAGERVSMSLLAMALEVRGVPAVSYTGSQAGILTNSTHGEARITRITGERVKDSLQAGRVVIVAGFQGVDPASKEVTTLGRGGSDTTAVALAATLGAGSCEINTDVEGVFAADPHLVPDATKIDEIGYDEMLAFAAAGAGVLMPHSVEFAQAADVPVHVRSSLGSDEGTWVRAGAPPHILAGITHQSTNGRTSVSLVGFGAAALAEQARSVLDAAGLPAILGDSDYLRVSFEIPREAVPHAVHALHDGFRPPLFNEENS